jgi:hypothetical protein
MTDGGRQKPPPDDRTLLDPLNADELRALREARAKMQAGKGGAVAHQVVIGPDGGEDIGDAPTRAMPSLPQFENNGATLEKVTTGSHKAVSTTAPAQKPPQQPMSMAPTQAAGPGPSASMPQQPPQGVAGATGFGENTLLWMAPPKITPAPAVGPAATAEMAKQAGAAPKRMLKTIGAAVVVLAIIGALSWAVLGKKERGVIDLHTNPPKASVTINGDRATNVTPMKLNLVEGTWNIEINLEGYKPYTFAVTVEKGSQPSRRDIDLEPISKAGLMTVGINVQPVSANITIDGETYPARRSVKVPNLDAKVPHKLVIEAGGYLKIEREIPANELKESYNLILQEDPNNKPQ